MAASAPLSNAGKVFFGSLCAGTFGLGCWQTQRFFEKIDLIEKRKRDLECEPEELLEQDTTTPASNWRRKRVVGTFRHGQEILVGPRGAPLGALEQMEGCPRGGVQGMASGPQGYFVVTPMDRTDGGEGTVFVNRGWIPRHLVKDVQPSAESWERPKGNVSVECVLAKPEVPRFMTPQHDFSTSPLQLFWMDAAAFQKVAGVDKTVLLTQIAPTNQVQQESFPVKPPLSTIGDFKTMPAIHAGYAVTWFGLSAAGLYMTRKLVTKGRG